MPNVNKFKTHEEYLQWYRDYRKMRGKELREYTRIYNNKWRKKNGYAAELRAKLKHPKKEFARKVLHEAITKGFIKRLPCEVCKNKKSHGHHTNYLKPLEVIWLCALHHTEIHKPKI